MMCPVVSAFHLSCLPYCHIHRNYFLVHCKSDVFSCLAGSMILRIACVICFILYTVYALTLVLPQTGIKAIKHSLVATDHSTELMDILFRYVKLAFTIYNGHMYI